jgi:phthiocerol/phenolphthiocerol synthesis type-I polyketide synthase E
MSDNNKNPLEYENIDDAEYLEGIAIIGMAARFPGADDIYQYRQNLEEGIESIAFYTDEELIEAGISPDTLKHPDYVKAKGEVSNVDMFDASFFGINPREAEVTDPQHRMLLECAWEAMEHAGYDSSKYDEPIGIFAGKSMDYYLLLNVYPRIRKEISAGSLQAAIGNDKDSLSTTISYRLNLTGPGISVQTSSSTSLVSVCVAAQSLLTYQCDIALAGGITAGPPIKSGYLYQEGSIWDPEGHCRAFDARAKGFVPGAGMGLVVLKRLDDAVKDGDTIWAVIKGYAVNNDGDKKVSYSAPSVDAQARVVAEAQAVADVHPETIQYIECHGTGTNLGDPIEITALTQAFRTQTDKKRFCAVGSAKTNIGHLDNAAGVAGLIKTTMALDRKKIPPTLHFKNPNPKIDFENSPFFVNTELNVWQPNKDIDGTPIPRRAGVTSLGMGGTNAHVILEEAPQPIPTDTPNEWQCLFLSAKTDTALKTKTADLLEFLKTNTPDTPEAKKSRLADTCYTLQVGRRDFNHRRTVMCKDYDEAISLMEELTPGGVVDSVCDVIERPVVFMFSGQGSQYVNMARELYEKQPLFKENMERCADILEPLLGLNPLHVLYPEENAADDVLEKNTELLRQTRLTQPVLFMVEYSLARMWMEWGIKPAAMIGHSIGEYTAACIAGSMSLEDALTLVAARGRLMFERPAGAMLSVGIDEKQLEPMLNENPELDLGAVNSHKHSVVSGTNEAIEKLENQLKEKSIFCKRLRTSHAFHSPMMEPILDVYVEAVKEVTITPPTIPVISGVTGTWLTEEEMCSPSYWAQQLRKAVRFADGIAEIMKDPSMLLLEVGPGNSLCVLAKEHKIRQNKTETPPLTIPSLRQAKQTEPDMSFLHATLCNLWLNGVVIDWAGYYGDQHRSRIPLPTYPFERKRYWLEEIKDKQQDIRVKAGEEESLDKASDEEPEAIVESTEAEESKTYQPRPRLTSEYKAPTNEIEEQISQMWADILGIKPIGIDDNFFDLGGHSLLATLFLSELQDKFQIRLELRNIFESPTIATIAELVKVQLEESDSDEEVENILNEIEGLSEEELRESLAEESEK